MAAKALDTGEHGKKYYGETNKFNYFIKKKHINMIFNTIQRLND